MKRIWALLICCTLLCLSIFTACSNDQTKNIDGISFEYLYRGFTPLIDDDLSNPDFLVLSQKIYVMMTEEDFIDFLNKHNSSRILSHIDMYDFSEECFIAECYRYTDSKPYDNISRDIKGITLNGNSIEISHDVSSAEIYALSISGDVEFWFVNIVKVKKSDLPSDVEDIYAKEK